MENRIEFVDLPNEIILSIFNQIQPQLFLLCSIIDIGNNRLAQVALDKCHSIDLTFDYYRSSNELFIERFYSQVMPRIYNNIQSLAFNLQHLSYFLILAEENCDGTLPNLKYLKIMIGKKCTITGTPFTLGNHFLNSRMREQPLFSMLPELFGCEDTNVGRKISNLRCSRFVRSIIWFELDDDCILPTLISDDELFFPQSSRLTHIRVTLR